MRPYDLRQPPPRPREVCDRVVRKHASWWGFATYGVLVVFVGATVGGALVATVLTLITAHWRDDELALSLWIPAMAIALVPTLLLFRRWVTRRRRDVEHVARDGQVIATRIARTSIANAPAIMSLATAEKPEYVAVVVSHDGSEYRAVVRSGAWTAADEPVDLIHGSRGRYALVIAPDGKDFLARSSRR